MQQLFFEIDSGIIKSGHHEWAPLGPSLSILMACVRHIMVSF